MLTFAIKPSFVIVQYIRWQIGEFNTIRIAYLLLEARTIFLSTVSFHT